MWEPRAHPALLAAASPLSQQVFGPAVASLPGPELPASGLDGPQGGEVNGTGARLRRVWASEAHGVRVAPLRRYYRVARGQWRN